MQAATAVWDPHDTLQEWYARSNFRLLSKTVTAQGQGGIGGDTALGLEKASQGVAPMGQALPPIAEGDIGPTAPPGLQTNKLSAGQIAGVHPVPAHATEEALGSLQQAVMHTVAQRVPDAEAWAVQTATVLDRAIESEAMKVQFVGGGFYPEMHTKAHMQQAVFNSLHSLTSKEWVEKAEWRHC